MPGTPIPQVAFPVERCTVKCAKHLGLIPTTDSAGNGVVVADLIGKTPAQVASKVPRAGDNVVAETGLKTIQLKILWTGYEHLEYTETHDVSGAWGQLGGLAIIAANAIYGFLQKAPRVKGHAGAFTITADQKFSIHNLAIVGIVHIAGDVFQAELQSVPVVRARRF